MLAAAANQLRLSLAQAARGPPFALSAAFMPIGRSSLPAALLSPQSRPLRTAAGCRGVTAAQGSPPQLSPHQSIVDEIWGERDAGLLEKINGQIVRAEAGRLFSVVFIRGKQHKVTSGQRVRFGTCGSR